MFRKYYIVELPKKELLKNSLQKDPDYDLGPRQLKSSLG